MITTFRNILINNHIDFTHVYSACEHVGGDKQVLLVVFKLFLPLQPFVLRQASVDSETIILTISQNFLQLICPASVFYKYHQLVKPKIFDKFKHFSVPLAVCKVNIILLQPVQCQITILVNDAFDFVSEELTACVFDWVRHSGRKHHRLFIQIAFDKNTLNVVAERDDLEQAVALVEHEILDGGHVDLAHLEHAVQAAGGGHEDVRFAL